jgi:hypothetical protein
MIDSFFESCFQFIHCLAVKADNVANACNARAARTWYRRASLLGCGL